MDIIDIKSLTLGELSNFIVTLGEKKFRGKQIFDWLHNKRVTTFDEMTNLSLSLIAKLKGKCIITHFNQVDLLVSKNDATQKFLFELLDHQVIESVLMKYKHGYSVCISSQVGCRMGCNFCASTIGGLIRNLEASEMLEQIYYIERYIKHNISNIVIMGTGEPFDNYNNFIKFVKIINSKEGRNISQRNITVSTCGIVPMIKTFADENMQVNLAISLHAPNDIIRKTMMPIANKYTIEEILDSCRDYIDKTHRRVTFEYSLVKGVNDQEIHAKALADRLQGMLCHVNLIPINSIEGKEYKKSDENTIIKFKKILERKHINATIRRSLGADIDAACGQLRRKYMDEI